jgi:hypothetical protein
MQLHPIMYVADQFAERRFYALFGFATVYEGEEFPGFLALQHGEAIIGLQRESEDHPKYREGLRWQFELETPEQIDSIISVCRTHALEHEVVTESGGSRFMTRIVKVRAPSGTLIWFESPNESPSG